MSTFDFKSSNVPGYGLGVDFGSMDTKGTLYGQQPITKAGKYAVMLTPEYKSATPEIQKVMLETELGNSSFNQTLAMFKNFKPTLAEEEAKLKMAGDFQNRQQAAAAPYNMAYGALNTLSKLPGQITENAANRAMLNVLGPRSVTEAFSQTMANYPPSKFQSTVPVVQRDYFT